MDDQPLECMKFMQEWMVFEIFFGQHVRQGSKNPLFHVVLICP